MSEIRVDTISEKTSTSGVSIDSVTLKDGGATLTDNITFSASGKGVHLGVTTATASNLLDDYEEGTFTPTLAGSSGTITCGTYGTLEYTKIGRKVFISGELRVSAISSPSGDFKLTGLPFAIPNLSGLQERTVSTVWIKNFGSTLDTPLLAKFESGSEFNFTVITNGDGGNINANIVEVGTELVFGATYITS